MVSFKSRYISKSLWGETTLMLVILAIALSVSYHYFMGAVTVCYGFVIGSFAGWLGKQRQNSRVMLGRNLGDARATALLISNDLHTSTVYAAA